MAVKSILAQASPNGDNKSVCVVSSVGGNWVISIKTRDDTWVNKRKSETCEILSKYFYYLAKNAHTSVCFWRAERDVTTVLALGLSRGSYCKQREAILTSSVPSSLEKWPSKHESVSIWKFFSRIKSSACKPKMNTNSDNYIPCFPTDKQEVKNQSTKHLHGLGVCAFH